MPTPVAPSALTAVTAFPPLSERAAGTYNQHAYDWATQMASTRGPELEALAANVYSNATTTASNATAAADNRVQTDEDRAQTGLDAAATASDRAAVELISATAGVASINGQTGVITIVLGAQPFLLQGII